ncbi:MAG: hypothetical protein WCL23_02565 [Candidatus Moraniibacteriota bacterium]
MKLLRTYMIRSFILLLAILGGCGTMRPNTVDLRNEKSEEVRKIAVDPSVFSGIPYTSNIQKDNFVAVLADVPQNATWFAEYSMLRIRYHALAFGADGREYPAYALYAGKIAGVRKYIVIVEGVTERRSDIRVQTYSTLFSEAYSLKGVKMQGFDEKRLRSSERYRAQICAEYGTPLGECRLVTGMRKSMGQWVVYKTPFGLIATPISEEKIMYLAGIDPQYRYWSKFKASATVAVSADYISTGIGAAIDFIRAVGVKSIGFDADSMQSRQSQGINMMYLAQEDQRDIQFMLQKTIQPPEGGGKK